MDVALEITSRIKELEGHASISGLVSATKHITIAESHYMRGVGHSSSGAFNDVIYRCNQAFEGMLKEAYLIITGHTDRKISPYEIETYFNNNNVLKPRVMDLIKNYRQDWRNPSTHDHTVEFNEDEALIAISNVSSFAFILLGNVIEFENQKSGAELAKNQDNLQPTENEALFETIKNEVLNFGEVIKNSFLEKKSSRVSDSLLGFLSSRLPDISFSTEKLLSAYGSIYRPDIFAERGSESLIVDVQYVEDSPTADQLESDEVFRFAAGIGDYKLSGGILYIYSEAKNIKSENTVTGGSIGNKIPFAVIVSK